ncbi:MAG: SRPBCC domain-containing protein [Anaerolineales bacterium]
MEKLKLVTQFSVGPQSIYEAWLDSEEHSAFTGSSASVEGRVGGEITAWDDYISGVILELEPYGRIVQSWRTTEFPEGSEDSRLEILVEAVEGGTRLTLLHSDIPEGQGEMYSEGWEDYYFRPMRAYFEGSGDQD